MKKPTVLVIDDDPINPDILRSALEEDYSVLEAADGEETLNQLSEHTDEVEGILLDLEMPKMDGFAFMERYEQEERWKNIPVLISSGDKRMQTENRCLETGAWDFIRKPFNPETVRLRLKNNISRRRRHLLETQKITNIFQHYVDPSVLKELLRNDLSRQELYGKNVEIAVLFADLRSFTALAEQVTPETVVEILNEYLTVTSRAVKTHGGTLDKFIGDCTMAFWGAPLPCEDGVYQACLAAVDMLEGGRVLTESMRRRFGREVALGIGIHVGRAVVGNIGAPDRLDYTAIGDAVNTASWLESIAPPGAIYISRKVADRLGSRAVVTSVGRDIRLKGKKEGFEVLTLDQLQVEGK